MVGASKIDEKTNDLERLQSLFESGLNNAEISRIYRTSSGKQISRIHISHIRRGLRWNPNKRSFLMKDELLNQDCITTTYNNKVIKTCISQVITDTMVYHVYLTYNDGKPIIHSGTSLMVNKPTSNDLIQYHINLINDIKGKNTES